MIARGGLGLGPLRLAKWTFSNEKRLIYFDLFSEEFPLLLGPLNIESEITDDNSSYLIRIFMPWYRLFDFHASHINNI